MSIHDRFIQFKEQYKESAFTKISEFLNQEKDIFYQKKIQQSINAGIDIEVASIKARQGWVAFSGGVLEDIVKIIISDFYAEHGLNIINDKQLRKRKLIQELDLVKRHILVNFGDYSVLPDGDLIIYQKVDPKPNIKVLAIISVKKSFRERYTETPYWKLKLLESEITKDIKVYMVTPDNDNEVSYNQPPRKARIVMEYELDGIYMAKENFDASNNVKSIEYLVHDLKKLITN
jgi:type II restriction enzyme